MKRREFIAGSIASSMMLATLGCTNEVTMPTPVIKIRSGQLQGSVVDGVHRYLGIPYAEPPFGANRFVKPVHRSLWDGVLSANAYGAICPQTGGFDSGVPDEGEDCLNLNVWTPDPSTSGLPVMVWAHGGGQVSGSGALPLYDGTHFAKDGVVLVTCNRRLGAEGYLYLEELFGDGIGPGNLGIQDMICVLEWVAENISKFGGDPNNVTLFGESGGGAATQAVIATPGSGGLVHRVIPQSGGHAAQRTETATKIAASALEQLDITPGDLDAMQQLPWQQFVAVYESLSQMEGVGQPQIYLPVINQHMPVHPVDAPFEGLGLEVDYLIGTCREEAKLFSALLGNLEGSIFHQRAIKVAETTEADWNDLIASHTELEHEAAFEQVLGDMWFRVPSIRIAEGHSQYSNRNTFMYLFEWESPLIGAAHALDVMVFGNGLPFSILAGFSDYDATAEFMRKAWVNFASSGDPSIPGFSWPRYAENRATVSLNQNPTVLNDPYANQRALLNNALTTNWQQLGL